MIFSKGSNYLCFIGYEEDRLETEFLDALMEVNGGNLNELSKIDFHL